MATMNFYENQIYIVCFNILKAFCYYLPLITVLFCTDHFGWLIGNLFKYFRFQSNSVAFFFSSSNSWAVLTNIIFSLSAVVSSLSFIFHSETSCSNTNKKIPHWRWNLASMQLLQMSQFVRLALHSSDTVIFVYLHCHRCPWMNLSYVGFLFLRIFQNCITCMTYHFLMIVATFVDCAFYLFSSKWSWVPSRIYYFLYKWNFYFFMNVNNL